MAVVTPEQFIDWADNSDSETTDPGSPLTADGWAVGSAPASSHFNYVLNSSAGYSAFVPRVLKAAVAWGNIDFTTGGVGGNEPFGRSSSTVFNTMFLQGRWYITEVTNTNVVNVFDSNDGNTWDYSLTIDGLINDQEITRPVIGQGGRLAFAIDGRLFVSSDNTIENLDLGTVGPWVDITKPRELVWDQVSELWVCVGTDGANNGKIETATDIDGAWTLRDSRGGAEYVSIAVSDSGVFLALTDTGSTSRISTDGITWIAGPATAQPWSRVIWDTSLNHFMARDTASNLWYVPENSTAEVDTGLNPTSIWQAPGIFITEDTTTGATFSTTAIGFNYEKQDFGFTNIASPGTFQGTEFLGGNGRIIFPYTSGNNTIQKAVAYYGALDGS